ncbi:fused MFS/spermidine synthase [Candidatus Parcubacteria bacterium]|jgi:spermidine synthase|nr:fused MFS/spermidine synthase [Candidatus Parcubacteria bacterium]MBT3948644.1 fused MFS/spermidine synthase [Candidatus Parcubacteria bacterium]
MKKYILELVVFVSGAVVMVFEIVGSRVLSPYIGNSVFVWTSLIGIILGSLSLGYWLGGKLSDKKANYKTLSWIIFISAILISVVTLVKEPTLIFLQQIIENFKLRSILSTITLFSLPSIFLGMVSPYAVKLKINSLETSGSTVGNLYAISTIGSIVGTFGAGFWLIPIFGTTKILLLLSIILALVSILLFTKKGVPAKLYFLAIIISSLLITNIVDAAKIANDFIDVDTQYSRIIIHNATDSTTKQRIKRMSIDGNASSAMFLENDDLVFEYTKYYDLAKHFNPDFKTSLLLGGAAFSYPKYYLREYPDASIDVVEIDPKVTKLAKEYFRLEEDSRLQIFHEDGRTFLNTTNKKYDVVFGDAFSSFYSLPYQLTTKEAVQKTYDVLNDNGVALVNIISAIEGDKGKFLRAEYATYKSIFPHVYIVPVANPGDAFHIQNIMLIALKGDVPPSFESEDSEINSRLDHVWKKEIPDDIPILTDEYAPVDYYIYQLM